VLGCPGITPPPPLPPPPPPPTALLLRTPPLLLPLFPHTRPPLLLPLFPHTRPPPPHHAPACMLWARMCEPHAHKPLSPPPRSADWVLCGASGARPRSRVVWQVRNSARIFGDPVLYRKMEAASQAIKRDICFASSLYIT
jgi:hypothetical protein